MLTFQIDPLASSVAVVALLVSVWAVVVAKREPHRARTRATRDDVRDQLLEARRLMGRLTDALGTGRDLPKGRDELERVCDTLKTLGPRLPEAETIDAAWGWLKFVNSYWHEVSGREEDIGRQRESRRKAREAQDASAAARYDDGIEASVRSRDAARVSLKEKIETARDLIDGYLSRVDAADRGRREI